MSLRRKIQKPKATTIRFGAGPASLAMVLIAFGLDVDPPSVRDYLNYLVGNYDTETGTSLYVLARIAREAGISKALLYHYFPSKQAYFSATLQAAA